MSKENLTTLLEELNAIGKEDVKEPNMPVDVAVQEAEDLSVWIQTDKDLLVAKGLDWTLVESIPLRAGACRYAQSQWINEYKAKEDAENLWAEAAPRGFELRDQLLHDFRFAYRNQPDMLAKVSLIAEGASREDMLQDLSDLAEVGRMNTAPLEAVAFNMTLLDEAETFAADSSVLLAGAKSESELASKALDQRNRAFTYMKKAVDEARSYGKYVFWKDEDRLKGYRSEYYHNLNRKYKKGNDEEDNQEDAA